MPYPKISLTPTQEDYQHVIDVQAAEITDQSLKLAILTRERRELAVQVEQLTPSVLRLQAQVDQLKAENEELTNKLAAKKSTPKRKPKNDANTITES